MAVSTIASTGAGPLTTVFTTPDFCASQAWTNYDTPALSSSICMPNRWMDYWNFRAGYYSPAICPLGYSSACSIPADKATGIDLGGPLKSGESGHICCPTGYTCFEGDPITEPWPYSKCRATDASTYTFYPATSITTTTPLVYAIQVRWKESDISSMETNPTAPGETNTPPPPSAGSLPSGAVATVTSTAAPTQPPGGDGDEPEEPGGAHRMSPQTKIGIAAGVPVAALVCALAGFLWWWRAHRNSRQNHPLPDGTAPSTPYNELHEDTLGIPMEKRGPHNSLVSPVSPLEADSVISPVAAAAAPAYTVAEMPGCQRQRAELDSGGVAAAEMPAPVIVAELPGDFSFAAENETGKHSERTN